MPSSFPANHPKNTDIAPAGVLEGTDVDPSSLSLEDGVSYVSSRALTWAMLSGGYGATAAYLQGVSVALPLYTYGISAALASSTFFGGAYIAKSIRKKDDFYNFAVSGAVNGFGSVAIFSGLKKGGVAGLVGGALGAAYGVASVWLFRSGREAWIEHRVDRLLHSQERKLIVAKPQFPTALESGDRKRAELLKLREEREKAKALSRLNSESTDTASEPKK